MVVINGARQSGKSTLVQSLVGPAVTPRCYLTLDDSVIRNAAKSDPAGFINGLQGPVTLDEVQRAPELFFFIKAAVDRDRQPGRFLLTCSADVMLLPGMADSLAGRIEVLSLWPLSCAEVADNVVFNRADALLLGDWQALRIPPCESNPGKDFNGLRHSQETEGAIFQRGMVLYAGREVDPFGENLWAVPLSIWWAA